jgi:AcrR family transcriptional regulator
MRMNEPNATRNALLDAARDLFARDGYDGTSIRAITARAGANLGAVTYHFGSKQRLYTEVLESFTLPLAARVRQAAASCPAPLDAVEAAVRALYEFLISNPAWPSLMLHEMALDRRIPAPMRRLMQSVLASITVPIRAGQRSGSIVRGDAQLLTYSVVAQPIYLALVRRRLREVFGIDADDPAMQRRIVDHAVRVVRRSLTSHGRKS